MWCWTCRKGSQATSTRALSAWSATLDGLVDLSERPRWLKGGCSDGLDVYLNDQVPLEGDEVLVDDLSGVGPDMRLNLKTELTFVVDHEGNASLLEELQQDQDVCQDSLEGKDSDDCM